MPTKRYLMTPGPTPVPPQVLAAMAEPIVHHRSPDFTPVFVSCLERLGRVFRTERDVLVLSASGTGAFESAVVNLLSPGERVLSVTSGNFGERWTSMAKAYGTDTQELRYAWGETPQPADLEARLEELGGASVVFLVHSETSTGVVSDVQALAAVAKRAGALVVVDAVSSLGGVPLETDAWGIDVVVTGSQKALMTPPGLGLVSVSEAAVEKSKGAALPRFYLDWGKALKAQGNKTTRLHARRLARRGPRRRAGDAARRGARRGLRPTRPPRPRGARRREGDGPRSLLARRGPQRGGRPRSAGRRAWTSTPCARSSATATA